MGKEDEIKWILAKRFDDPKVANPAPPKRPHGEDTEVPVDESSGDQPF